MTCCRSLPHSVYKISFQNVRLTHIVYLYQRSTYSECVVLLECGDEFSLSAMFKASNGIRTEHRFELHSRWHVCTISLVIRIRMRHLCGKIAVQSAITLTHLRPTEQQKFGHMGNRESSFVNKCYATRANVSILPQPILAFILVGEKLERSYKGPVGTLSYRNSSYWKRSWDEKYPIGFK